MQRLVIRPDLNSRGASGFEDTCTLLRGGREGGHKLARGSLAVRLKREARVPELVPQGLRSSGARSQDCCEAVEDGKPRRGVQLTHLRVEPGLACQHAVLVEAKASPTARLRGELSIACEHGATLTDSKRLRGMERKDLGVALSAER